jgi:hypothetical protein
MNSALRTPMQPPLIRVPQNIAVMDIAGARGWLGAEFSEDDVLDLIATGDLAWAWNIAQKCAKRREVRILSWCVCHYRQTLGSRPQEQEALSFDGVCRAIIPQKAWGKPVIAGIDLADAMLFGSDLLQDLIADGSLKAGTEPRPGRGGSALLKMPGVLDFLKQRRIQ